MVLVVFFFVWTLSCAEQEALFTLLSNSLLSDKVSLHALSPDEIVTGGFVGRFAMVAVTDLKPPQKLATLDWAQCLTGGNVSCSTCSPLEKVMLRVLAEDAPTWVRQVSSNSPLTWPQKTLDLLVGTQLAKQIDDQIEELKVSYKRNNKQPEVTFDQWKAAFALVKALMFYVDTDPHVVPWVSLFSFGEKGKAHLHELEDGVLEIRLGQPVSKGQIVSLNDDEVETSSNMRLFPLYGMLLREREFGFLVSVGLDKNDPMFGNKREMFDKRFGDGKKVEKNVFCACYFFGFKEKETADSSSSRFFFEWEDYSKRFAVCFACAELRSF